MFIDLILIDWDIDCRKGKYHLLEVAVLLGGRILKLAKRLEKGETELKVKESYFWGCWIFPEKISFFKSTHLIY
jgi:hypothetical protein